MPSFLTFRLRTDGLEGVREYALQVRENAQDVRPALEVVAENLRAHQRRAFDTQGASLGRAWEPLRPRTVAARAAGQGHYAQPSRGEGPAGRILHWTHALRESLTTDQAPGAIASISRSTLLFGTAVPYGAAVNARRRFFDFPDALVTTEMVQPVQQYLLGRDPRTGQGARRTRRRISGRGGVTRPISVSEAAD